MLKNMNGELPLQASGLKSIAIVGSHADIAVLSGEGSAQVAPIGGAALTQPPPCPPCWAPVIWDPSSPLRSIQALVPDAKVDFLADFMLLLDRSRSLQRRTLVALQSHPQLFSNLLSMHVGQMEPARFLTTAASLGWQFVAS